MSHHINDHAAVGTSVAVPSAFLDKLHDFLVPMHEHAKAVLEDRARPADPSPEAPTPAFSDPQFTEIVRLLTPIHDLAVKVLEQMAIAGDDRLEGLKSGPMVVHDAPQQSTGTERSASEKSSG